MAWLILHVLIFKGFDLFLHRFWELTRSRIGFKNKQRKSGKNHLQQCPREYQVVIRMPAIQHEKNMRMTRELCQNRRKIKERLRQLLCYWISMIQQKKTEKFEREAMHHSGHVIVVCKSWAWKRCIMCTSREFGWETVVALWPFMRSTLLLKFNTWMKATGQKWFIFEDII